jgi:hypothetical protein
MECPSCGSANPAGKKSVAIAAHRCRSLVRRAALKIRRARDFVAITVLH